LQALKASLPTPQSQPTEENPRKYNVQPAAAFIRQSHAAHRTERESKKISNNGTEPTPLYIKSSMDAKQRGGIRSLLPPIPNPTGREEERKQGKYE